MNNYLVKVKEFMTTFGQPVLNKPTPLPEDRQKLRIALIFEELKEYAEASGKYTYFNDLCDNNRIEYLDKRKLKTKEEVDTPINQIEQLDALLDLQYVLSGAVHEQGFGEIFDEAFEEVHSSNMSKADISEEDVITTMDNYKDQGISTTCKKINGLYCINRLSDKKVLKSHKYKPAELAQFLKK